MSYDEDDAEEMAARRATAIDQAHALLKKGQPTYALALGLYLHWKCDGEQEEASGQLLHDAYMALGLEAFAEILDVHLRFRDLGSVGVFED